MLPSKRRVLRRVEFLPYTHAPSTRSILPPLACTLVRSMGVLCTAFIATGSSAFLGRPVYGTTTPRRPRRTALPLRTPRATLAGDRPALQDVNEAVVKAVERVRGNGRVTPSDVAVSSGLSVPEAETELARLAGLTGAAVDVTDAGDLAYRFSDVRAKLRNASLRASLRMAWDRAFPYLFTGVRIAFGSLLILSIIVTFLAITALMAASRSSDERENRSPSGFFAMRMFTPNIFDVILYTRVNQQYGYYDDRRAYHDEPQEMSFLESVYSFVFGDGDPNADAEQRQWKAIAALITANDGAVTAEQLRPFVLGAQTPSGGGAGYVDESDVLPVLTRFNGRPEVTADGDIIYVFPEFATTARRVEFAGAAATHLAERTSPFSRATGGQRALTIGLGILNVVGAVTLGSLLGGATAVTPDAEALLSLIKAVYPAIAAYAMTFVLVPIARLFWIRRRNSEIERRNEIRLRAAAEVARPRRGLREKLSKARDYRVERRTVSERDVVYSSDMDSQEVERRRLKELADDFDRRVEGR